MRILMVCLGNICRSPLADGVLRHKVKERNLPWVVDSAGTASYHIGSPPDLRMVKTASKHGVDIGFLRARQFTSEDFNAFDRILVMDKSNYVNVLNLASYQEDKNKVMFLMDYLHPSQQKEVPDPYYGVQEDFDVVYKLVDEATDAILIKESNEY